jgi:hypothetical protein
MYFMIIYRDEPVYEAEFGPARKEDSGPHSPQFIVHAALDLVEDAQWATNSAYLKVVDRFQDSLVSAFVTGDQVGLASRSVAARTPGALTTPPALRRPGSCCYTMVRARRASATFSMRCTCCT